MGDSSIANGLSLEGLNHAADLKRQLLIILNDNGMSISKPQGALAQYLDRLRVSTTYDEAKKIAERVVGRLPSNVAQTVEAVWHHVKEGLKSAVWPGQPFESLGLKYFGPIDGHDITELLQALSEIKHLQTPVVLHVRTVKGNGYKVAVDEPTKFHSPSSFKFDGEQVEFAPASGKSWTNAFADALIAIAKTDKRVFGITAAMPDGTGIVTSRDVVRNALRMRPDVIFFLTDADEPELRTDDFLFIRRLNQGTSINTIEFGRGPPKPRYNFLQKLAAENGGQHSYVDVTRLAR